MTVLAVTTDVGLMDDIRRLVMASAQEVHCANSVGEAQSRWAEASLIFLGSDQVSAVRSAAMPQREKLVVVAQAGSTDTIYREAMSVGAEQVVQLPDDESWVTDHLAQIDAEEGRRGLVVAVIGGSGGVGCTSFVAACAMAARSLGKSPVVVDLDSVGCGLDVVLGGDEPQPGVRWSELYRVSGRVPGKSLVDGLPRVGEIPVLSWGETQPQLPSREALGIVLDSLKTSFDVVLVDLPRASQDIAKVVMSRAQVVSFLARSGVIGGLAAKRAAEWILESHSTVDLLVRPRAGGDPTGSDIRDLGELLGIDPLLIVPDCKEVEIELEAGLAPGTNSKSKLGSVAKDYVLGLDQLREGG